MKAHHKSFIASTIAISTLLGIAMPRPAFSENVAGRDANALLDEAKKNDYERKIAALQTELNRLSEDSKKGAEQISSIEKSIEKVGSAVSDSVKQLDQLSTQKRVATYEMEVLNLRIEAERLKGEGLRMLEAANKKAMEATAKLNEETDAKAAIVAAESRQLAAKTSVHHSESDESKGTAKNEPTLSELRKKLESVIETLEITMDRKLFNQILATADTLEEDLRLGKLHSLEEAFGED